MPGEISLAHNGILFLDEIAEFNKKTLDALRQPMEDGKVTIARVKHTHLFPTSFMLVSAMNPCPCGYYGESRCRCPDYEVLRYREKLSGPIMDRIDIQKYFKTVDIMDLSDNIRGPKSKDLLQRVEVARAIQRKRYKGILGVSCNSQMTPELIKKYCKLEPESMDLLKVAYDKFRYSAKPYHKFLRVARTFADMEEEKNINDHIIIIKNVPVNICTQCGEYYIENKIALILEKLIDEVLTNSLTSICNTLEIHYNVDISEAGFNYKFTDEAVAFISYFLEVLIKKKLSNNRFSDCCFTKIRIADSTTIKLPVEYYDIYPGAGPKSGKEVDKKFSALKIQHEFDLLTGNVLNFKIEEAIRNDALFLENITPDVKKMIYV